MSNEPSGSTEGNPADVSEHHQHGPFQDPDEQEECAPSATQLATDDDGHPMVPSHFGGEWAGSASGHTTSNTQQLGCEDNTLATYKSNVDTDAYDRPGTVGQRRDQHHMKGVAVSPLDCVATRQRDEPSIKTLRATSPRCVEEARCSEARRQLDGEVCILDGASEKTSELPYPTGVTEIPPEDAMDRESDAVTSNSTGLRATTARNSLDSAGVQHLTGVADTPPDGTEHPDWASELSRPKRVAGSLSEDIVNREPDPTTTCPEELRATKARNPLEPAGIQHRTEATESPPDGRLAHELSRPKRVAGSLSEDTVNRTANPTPLHSRELQALTARNPLESVGIQYLTEVAETPPDGAGIPSQTSELPYLMRVTEIPSEDAMDRKSDAVTSNSTGLRAITARNPLDSAGAQHLTGVADNPPDGIEHLDRASELSRPKRVAGSLSKDIVNREPGSASPHLTLVLQ